MSLQYNRALPKDVSSVRLIYTVVWSPTKDSYSLYRWMDSRCNLSHCEGRSRNWIIAGLRLASRGVPGLFMAGPAAPECSLHVVTAPSRTGYTWDFSSSFLLLEISNNTVPLFCLSLSLHVSSASALGVTLVVRNSKPNLQCGSVREPLRVCPPTLSETDNNHMMDCFSEKQAFASLNF